MTERKTYDVAVVGYGPVGCTAANLLGQLGLNVVVVERDPDIYARARAISTDEEVVRIWQQVGLADRLNADMLPGCGAAFVDANGVPFVRLMPISRGNGHPPQQFIYQPALEKVLRDGVDRFPNVSVLLKHECLRLVQKDDHVELLLANLTTDQLRRIRASYVIAADGGSSATRAQLGVGFSGRTYAERWIVIDTKVLKEWPGHDRLRFHCNPERPTVDCPTPLGHHRWEFPVRDEEDERDLLSDDAIWKVLRRQGISPENVQILGFACYSHHVRFADRWRVGRVFLAGDAAHAMPPWIGQGMCAGVRDVANLCWKLGAVLNGSLPEAVLDSYQCERLPHVKEVTDRAVKTGKLIIERNRFRAAARNHLFRAASKVPYFTTWLRNHRWLPDARYRDGLLARNGNRAVGWLIPQPWVFDEKGDSVRLDDVVGGRWTVLHTGGRSECPDWRAAGVPVLQVAPPGSVPRADSVVDSEGVLSAWLNKKGAAAVAVRPDGFVYAGATDRQPLPPPPAGFNS
ncbi:bifunctional 3-(3-hydroxy-phenyl)propionate/3-hydroxycinnamic acid hydroxylase [Mycobacterium stomatepiae]|uniref:3-(3-hydroxy-phenyl)propionate/3-hydroxycinnamic acid hydroxylase n=1 Tax=Mycobacterium stomatepiae TaxID=470076 RepID=A0A7I7QGB3_9MYCO|nr:bifunctional 3-(3-hydroxy-phenyl)propionate/3-hydroxycinnamic acid hydroxylase [Mycobacterium stomatepiae]MCV7166783.1 bifunctional 3-(3-hydroxy-phenyl)propionate/3-hydroxycinnamic acid hydroxylase [Mycobacterium stomatepiae]BBY25365.1 3-(3-hydroxy-phenyl)propionate/3-hydroxycinnamic acid hydroxylase [Mycobacterium stomatepiae]